MSNRAPTLRPSRLQRLALCALALPFAACAIERPPEKKLLNKYLAEPADLANVRRIMVLPFQQEGGDPADCEDVRDVFVTELQKLRRFEVVPLPANASENDAMRQSLRRGRLSTEAVVRLCNRYALDGVMLGTVTAWRPYTPPHLGLRTQLLSVHSGAPVWAVDAMFDSSDRSTVQDLRHYEIHQKQDNGSLHSWELDLLAPTKFTHYVANRFVGTWVEG